MVNFYIYITKCDIVETRIESVVLSLCEDTPVDCQLTILSSFIREWSIGGKTR